VQTLGKSILGRVETILAVVLRLDTAAIFHVQPAKCWFAMGSANS
jgi:hypothetical protein